MTIELAFEYLTNFFMYFALVWIAGWIIDNTIKDYVIILLAWLVSGIRYSLVFLVWVTSPIWSLPFWIYCKVRTKQQGYIGRGNG